MARAVVAVALIAGAIACNVRSQATEADSGRERTGEFRGVATAAPPDAGAPSAGPSRDGGAPGDARCYCKPGDPLCSCL